MPLLARPLTRPSMEPLTLLSVAPAASPSSAASAAAAVTAAASSANVASGARKSTGAKWLVTRCTPAAGAASAAVPLPSWHRGRVSTLADACFHKQRRGPCWGWKLCWSGSWAGLPLHRKIDLVFGVVVLVVYIIATCVILMGGLGFNLNECQQGVNCN